MVAYKTLFRKRYVAEILCVVHTCLRIFQIISIINAGSYGDIDVLSNHRSYVILVKYVLVHFDCIYNMDRMVPDMVRLWLLKM